MCLCFDVAGHTTPHSSQAAIRDPNPVVILEHELLYGDTFEMSEEAMSKDWLTPFGLAKVEREGTDVSIVTFSRAVGKSLQAAEKLAEEGISVEVVNLRSLRPLDRQAIIDTVKKTKRLVTVEEGWPQSGVGAEVAAVVMECACFLLLLFIVFVGVFSRFLLFGGLLTAWCRF